MVEKVNDVSGFSDAALLCRLNGFRHAWIPAETTEIVENARGHVTMYTVVMVCERGCGATKELQFDRASGWRFARKPPIKYGDGYLMAKGVERPDQADIGDELFLNRALLNGSKKREVLEGGGQDKNVNGRTPPAKKAAKKTPRKRSR